MTKKTFLTRAVIFMVWTGVMVLPLGLLQAADKGVIGNPLGAGATFETIIKNVVKFANSILAPLSTIMVLIAGFFYMTGGGDPERLKTARKTLIWAVVGTAIVLLSNGALAIIKSVLGTK